MMPTCDQLLTLQRGFDLFAFMALSVAVGVCLAKMASMRKRVWVIGEKALINEREIKDLKELLGDKHASRH